MTPTGGVCPRAQWVVEAGLLVLGLADVTARLPVSALANAWLFQDAGLPGKDG